MISGDAWHSHWATRGKTMRTRLELRPRAGWRWIAVVDPGATIGSDGQTIGGTWTRVDSDGTKTTVWDFRSVREP
jgi:hypothetical protein